MTHVTDERKAQLDAAAEERAAFLEEVKHPVAGLHVQSLIDEPESYHAGQLTPAYHVPGNVERNPLFPLTTESIQEAATEGVELVPADPVVIDIPVIPLNDSAKANAASLDSAPDIETKEYSDGTTATGVAPLPDQSPAQQEATLVDPVDPTSNSGETTLPTDPLPEVQSNTSSETEQSNG